MKTNAVKTERKEAVSRDGALRPAGAPAHNTLSLSVLLAACALALAATFYPPALTDSDGKADHTLLTVLGWAVAAGLVRGVGYIPETKIWRIMFSGAAFYAATAVLAVLWVLAQNP